MTLVPFPITDIDNPSSKFAKQVKSLGKNTQNQLKSVINELMSGELSPGRNLEKFTGLEGVYTVRLNRKERFAFLRKADDTIKPIAVGNHDTVYRVKRRHLGN